MAVLLLSPIFQAWLFIVGGMEEDNIYNSVDSLDDESPPSSAENSPGGVRKQITTGKGATQFIDQSLSLKILVKHGIKGEQGEQ